MRAQKETSPAVLSYLRPLALGVVTGMRSMLPLALLATAPAPERQDGERPVLGGLRARPGRILTCAAAGGEMIADKLPFVPSRIERGPLTGRLFLGGLAGLLFSRERGLSPCLGAGAGALGAAAGSFGGYYARRGLGQVSHLPDPVWAVSEDATALGLGRWAVGAD